jgi:hypothetical protein
MPTFLEPPGPPVGDHRLIAARVAPGGGLALLQDHILFSLMVKEIRRIFDGLIFSYFRA